MFSKEGYPSFFSFVFEQKSQIKGEFNQIIKKMMRQKAFVQEYAAKTLYELVESPITKRGF